MGRVADPELLSLLMSHYEQEETQFLKGDYLEAVEAFDLLSGLGIPFKK